MPGKSAVYVASRRQASTRQYGPLTPINAAPSLTRSAERISKWQSFGSADRGQFEASLKREAVVKGGEGGGGKGRETPEHPMGSETNGSK